MKMPQLEASQQATVAILACVRKVSQVCVEDAQALQKLLSDSCLTEDAKKEILDAIDVKVQLDHTGGGGDSKVRQELASPENYQSDACWDVYRDSKASVSTKLLTMAQRLVVVGGMGA